MLREALVALLDAEPDIAPVADTDELGAVLDLCREHRADAAVLDMEVGGESSSSWLARFRAEMPDVKLVIFSGHAHRTLIERTLAAGASAYVVKSGNPSALIDAIRELRGAAPISPG